MMSYQIPAAEPEPDELALECEKAAENAVEWVRSMTGIDLDYSPPSLMALDRVLDKLIPSLGDDEVHTTIILLGSYLGETMIRAMGGRWETGDVFAGPLLHGLEGREIVVSPFLALRQALSGLEDHTCSLFWNSVIENLRKSPRLDDLSGFRPAPGLPVRLLPVNVESATGTAGLPSNEDLAKAIIDETGKFIGILKSELGFELDYSLDSLRFIDTYIGSLHTKMSEHDKKTDIRVFVYLLGNYIGEVLRRRYGGSWVFENEDHSAALVLRNGGLHQEKVYPHKVAAHLTMEYKEGELIDFARLVHSKLSLVK